MAQCFVVSPAALYPDHAGPCRHCRGVNCGCGQHHGVAGHGLSLSRCAVAGGGAGPAAGLSGLCAGLCLYLASGSSRSGANPTARSDGLGAARLLVSRNPQPWRRGLDADHRAVPLCLPVGAGLVPAAILKRLSGGAHLGRSPMRAFLRVALPMARPAIAGGALLAVMETIADYGTVAFFNVQTFATG